MVVDNKFWGFFRAGQTLARFRATIRHGLRLLSIFLILGLLMVGLEGDRTGSGWVHAEDAPAVGGADVVPPGRRSVAPGKTTQASSPMTDAAVVPPSPVETGVKPSYLVRLEEWNRQTPIEDDFHDSDLLGEMGYWFAEMGAADLKGSVNLEVTGRQTNPHLRFDFEVGGGGWQFVHAQLAFWRRASLEGGLLRFRIRADRPMSVALCLIEERATRGSGWERRLSVDTEWREVTVLLDDTHFTWSEEGRPPQALRESLQAVKGLKWRCSEAESKGTLFLDDISLKQGRL